MTLGATQAAVGGVSSGTFKPTPAATGEKNQGTDGEPRRDAPPLSPLSPPQGRGMLEAGLGDVGPVPPPPDQGSPPPPPPPPPSERAAAPGEERR